MELKKNQIVTLEITGLTSEGSGVSRLNGMVIFVPFTALGDKIEAKILKVTKSCCYGKIERIITPSPDRREVDCAAFGKCGGCVYRHISYEAELRAKEQSVKDAFERIGGLSPEFLPIVPNENTERYRNKAQYPVAKNADGKTVYGFFAANSHRIIPCHDCKLQPEIFSEIATAVTEFAAENKISAYDEAEHKGILRHVCIRKGHYSGEINVTVVVRKKVPEMKLLPSYLSKRFSDIKSVVVSVNPKKTNVVLGESQYVLYNRAHIFDTMCENEICISPSSFYQVNTPMAQKLYKIAADLAQAEGKIILDLYCGAGTIGLSMAKTAKQVIGVEIVESAVANARKNAERNGYKNAEFICADAGEATTELLQRGVKPDVVVIDPARQGCDKKALDNIASFGAEKIVMISCNPATAARDCSYLAQKGYLTKTVQAVDLFSRTKHCECVILLSRQVDTHQMQLNHSPFVMIKSGTKTIELRLYDEKRKKIKVGDRLVFTDNTTGQTLEATVINLHVFDSFEQLYKALPLLQCGYTDEDIESAKPSDMEEYYSAQKQKQYGVVGIEIRLGEN